MSIEQKIAEILAESRLTQVEEDTDLQEDDLDIAAELEEDTEDLDEAALNPNTDGVTHVAGENEANSKNNVGNQKIGGKSKTSNVVNKDEEAQEQSHIASMKSDGVTKVAGDEPNNARNINSMREDIEALVSGEELTEEFKEKAATIFEAAVTSRVKQEVAKLDEAYELKLNEQVEEIKEGLVDKIDGYLDYIVEQWMEQNAIALERGMKSEILEGFVGGLKSLFEEHYIDIPEEKFDVLSSLEEQVEDLHSRLDEQVEQNVSLNKEIVEYQKAMIVSEMKDGLVATDQEKFEALVEELEFDGVDSFIKKAKTIRESYFTNKAATKSVASVVTDNPVSLTEENHYVDPSIKGYLSVLDKLK